MKISARTCNTPIASKATKALEAWIESQIPEEEEEGETSDAE